MKIISDYYIVLVDKRYKSDKTKSGMDAMNEAYLEDWAEDHLKYRTQSGTIIEKPAGFTETVVDIVTPGMPEPKLFISGDFIAQKLLAGYTKLPKYSPHTYEGFDVITLADIAKKVDVEIGDKVYFDYMVTEMDRYLGEFRGMSMYRLRVDEIYCAIDNAEIMNAKGQEGIKVRPQGLWCLVEPNKDSWESITTKSGLLRKPKPDAKYLDGNVAFIQEREDIKPGDNIVYQRHADYAMKIEGNEYFVMKEEDILCKR